MLNKENFALGVINNILIIDKKNTIVFIGDNIRDIIYKRENPLGNSVFSEFPGKSELLQLSKAIDFVRREKKTKSFQHNGLKKKLILFPANYGRNESIIVSFEDQIIQGYKISTDLKERVKELHCLYSISHEINASKKLDQVFENVIQHIINGFQFTEITSVAIKFDKNVYGSDRSKNSSKFLSEKIVVNNVERGSIVVFYSENEVFLDEEQALLREIADSFSKTIERVESRQDLEKKKKILEKKNDKLLKLTKECSRNRAKLEIIVNAITDKLYVIEREKIISMSNIKNICGNSIEFDEFLKEELSMIDGQVMSVFNSGKSSNFEKKIKNTCFSIRVYPIFSNENQVEKVLLICRDISEKKELEIQMLQTNKLASLGRLVSGIAHEINNPNTFIMGNIKIIKESFDDLLPILDGYSMKNSDLKIARLDYKVFKENIPFLINDMFDGSNRIKKIVDDLRNFARKDEGLLKDNIDINLVVNNAYRLVSSQVRRMADVELNLGKKLPEFVGNFQKLEQVIVNMILNAAQSIESPKGKVIISTQYDIIENHIKIAIDDNGKGIDNTILSSIFDPFFTTKRSNGGTGLGLSISYGIIAEHGGEIKVRSDPGKGSEFLILIPVRGKD